MLVLVIVGTFKKEAQSGGKLTHFLIFILDNAHVIISIALDILCHIIILSLTVAIPHDQLNIFLVFRQEIFVRLNLSLIRRL